MQVIYYVATSLDGYIATPDGGVEWLPIPDREGEDYGYAEFYASVDAVLMGRSTYEKSLEFGEWVYPGKPCWVFSRQQIDINQPDVTLTSCSPGEVVAELEARQFKRAWLVGGGQLASSFRAHGLISEYIITIIPTILGKGIPLFTSSDRVEKLKLVDTQTFEDGLIALRYVQVPNG
ncbi:MAG: dihydrofolate reductase [Oscillatoriales cyanobacterium C42_A2020_001]|nr:dihydrofolate reductase [Leptolyngbyaceae cyanobacterium C42_A2020_001]